MSREELLALAERAYRDLHPPMFPYSPWERKMELRDLWPSEQAKFVRTVSASLRSRAAMGEGL